ncbi:hypothetical protein PoB_004186900 [Plakobranchus ocellatus]|uniref:Uncharacterized protein n=1 Tax=Plakobranchus ocellatus TaxID=259542 RepID=A0AAV4B5I0_9GAST|nr:hypothetical protein PoB_004186900 [Plakobranchus ocellatus]
MIKPKGKGEEKNLDYKLFEKAEEVNHLRTFRKKENPLSNCQKLDLDFTSCVFYDNHEETGTNDFDFWAILVYPNNEVKLSDSFVPLVAKLVWKHLGNSSDVLKWRYLRLQKTHYDKAEHPFDRIEGKNGRSETALYRYINASRLVGHLLNKNVMHAFLRRDRGWKTSFDFWAILVYPYKRSMFADRGKDPQDDDDDEEENMILIS